MTQEAVGKYRREWGRDGEVRHQPPERRQGETRVLAVEADATQRAMERPPGHRGQYRGRQGGKQGWLFLGFCASGAIKVEINKDEKQVCWVGGSYFI